MATDAQDFYAIEIMEKESYDKCSLIERYRIDCILNRKGIVQ